jgi:hypothetical protein
MSQQKPKKPRQPKSKRLKLSKKEEWTRILKDVEKNEIPVHFLKSITVNLLDGTSVEVNITQLLSEGLDPETIEQRLNEQLVELDDYIEDVDFYINVDSVSRTVQPFTDELLKDL